MIFFRYFFRFFILNYDFYLYLCPLNTGICLGGGAGATFVEIKKKRYARLAF